MDTKKTDELVDKLMKGEISLEHLNTQIQEANHGVITNPKLNINFINDSANEDPRYAKDGDSGFDLRAKLLGPITLGSLDRAVIPTGIRIELPIGLEAQVRSRSGLAAKHGISVLNSPGTVDSGYRGEVGVILVNLSKEDFVINNGDRIAQVVIAPVTAGHVLDLTKVTEINEDTDRGTGAYGSTGVK